MFHVERLDCNFCITVQLTYTPNTIYRRDKAKRRFDPGTLHFTNRTAHAKVKSPKHFTWNRVAMSKLVTYIGILITYSMQFSS